ncbi:MAG: ABC transporter permease [Pseudomonadota bacterium]
MSSDTDLHPAPLAGADLVVIRPSTGWVPVNLRALWAYRELLVFLAWRDISVRYKQTVLGALWAIIQPFFSMVVFTLFFGTLAKIPSDGVPYPVFSYAALLPWTYFAAAVSRSSNSLVGSQNLLTKVYFPRLVIPLSSVLPPLVDFCIAFTVLIGLLIYYGIAPTINVVWLPAFLLLAMVTALAVGLWLSALNVEYRDVAHTLPFMVQLWLFASPVTYPTSMIPERWHSLYALNPMTGVIEGFRWALLGTGQPPGPVTLVSTSVTLLLLVGGAYYFRRTERTFADRV